MISGKESNITMPHFKNEGPMSGVSTSLSVSCAFWGSFPYFVCFLPIQMLDFFVILYTIYYYIIFVVLYYNTLEDCLFSNETPKGIQRGGVVVRNWEKHRERKL